MLLIRNYLITMQPSRGAWIRKYVRIVLLSISLGIGFVMFAKLPLIDYFYVYMCRYIYVCMSTNRMLIIMGHGYG